MIIDFNIQTSENRLSHKFSPIESQTGLSMLYGGPYPIHPIVFPVPAYLMMTERPKSWILNKHVDIRLCCAFETRSGVVAGCVSTDTMTVTVIIHHHSLSLCHPHFVSGG